MMRLRQNYIRLGILLLLPVLVIGMPLKVFAEGGMLSDEQSRIGNGIFYYNANDVCGSAATDPTITPAADTGGGDPKPILEFFVGKGLTLAAAAGFAGNMKQESGLNPKNVQNEYQDEQPNVKINGGGDAKTAQENGGKMYIPIDSVGIGLVQWSFGGYKESNPKRLTPDKFNDRQGALYHFAKEKGMDIVDINLQLEFVWKELTSGYKVSTLNKLDGITDPVEAAIIIEGNYEISGDSDATVRSVRGGNAQAYYDQFKGKIADGSGATTSTTEVTTASGETCGSEVTDTGGIGEANGLTFPLKTTQAAIKKGADGAVWCFESQTNCHHDYNAADIFAETGTPIIAAKAGKVVRKTTDSCDYYGCNVSVKGDDGLLYYYTHMSKHATVDVGQKVSAGEQIGTVGTNATAMNTPRHLHFDITRGSSRPSCSGSSCKDSDFINVQSVLVPAFEALPKGAVSV